MADLDLARLRALSCRLGTPREVQVVLDALPALLDASEERDRLREQLDGALGTIRNLQEARAQLDAVERDLRRRFELHDERIALMHAIQRKEARREQLIDTAGAYNRECDEIDARLRAALTPQAPTTTKEEPHGNE